MTFQGEHNMHPLRTGAAGFLLACAGLSAAPLAHAADIIVSAQDGKFVRVEGRATFPEPAPPDSLVGHRCLALPAGRHRAQSRDWNTRCRDRRRPSP